MARTVQIAILLICGIAAAYMFLGPARSKAKQEGLRGLEKDSRMPGIGNIVVRGGLGVSRLERGGKPRWGAGQPMTQVLFSKNACKNERIGSGSRFGARRKLWM